VNNDPFRRRRAIEVRKARDDRFLPHTPMGRGGEFDVIRRMLERWGPRARRIGDDAAVITSLGDRAFVASTDTSIEGVHFKRVWLTPAEFGYRATAAALSDLAAMAARPLGVIVAMAIPDEWRVHVDHIADGIGDAAGHAEAPILGGDMSRSNELVLTITVLGLAQSVLFRTGARAGDVVYVTGRLGGAQQALDALSQGRELTPDLRGKFAHPVPRIPEAEWLAEQGASAAIDISDGLASDLAHIASASRVRISVDLDCVPLFDDAEPAQAVISGEEYEVVVTSQGEIDTGEFSGRFGLDLTRIGVVDRGEPGVVFTSRGKPVTVGNGYLHF
jgi:thiamine-monophosphate kinase